MSPVMPMLLRLFHLRGKIRQACLVYPLIRCILARIFKMLLSRIFIELETLILRTTTTYFTAFILTGVLLIAFDSLAFAQGDGSRSERQSPETASQAEALFQNALLLFDNHDSKSARLQLQEAMRLWMRMREPEKAAMAALQM